MNIYFMIIMGQWTRVENSNEVFLRVTNHTGQAEKNLLGPAGIRTRDLRLLVRYFTNWATGQVGRDGLKAYRESKRLI